MQVVFSEWKLFFPHAVFPSSPQFFNKRKTYYAYDPQKVCTEGDIVLLRALPQKRDKYVTHDIAEIVYKIGRVIDPVTGKPCTGERLLESVTDSGNLTENDTAYLSEKIQELTVSSQDKWTFSEWEKPSETSPFMQNGCMRFHVTLSKILRINNKLALVCLHGNRNGHFIWI